MAAGAYLTPLAADLARAVWSALNSFREEGWDPAMRERVERLKGGVEGLVREVGFNAELCVSLLFDSDDAHGNCDPQAYPPLRDATRVTLSSLVSLASSPSLAAQVQGTPLYPPIAAEPQPQQKLTATALDLTAKGAIMAGTAAVSLASLAAQNVPPLTAKLIQLLNQSQLPPALVAAIWNSSRSVVGVLAYLQAVMVEYGRRELDRRRHKQDGGRGMVLLDQEDDAREEGEWLVVGARNGSGPSEVDDAMMDPGGI
jgi:hypothetical protein